MRTTMKKAQVKILSDGITNHVEALCDDLPRWISALKFTYGVLVTLDNMGVDKEVHGHTVITLDKIFEQLCNEANPNNIDFPNRKAYYA